MKRIEQILLFLTLLFLPTQLGRHFWPQFSFVYSLPIDYLSPVIYFWDLLAVSLMAIWIVNKPHINRAALNLLLIFILSQLVSLIGGDGAKIGHGLVRLQQYVISGLFGIYLASADLKRVKTTILGALGLAVLGESSVAILQFLKGGTLGLWILGERSFSLSTPAIAKFDFYGRQFLRPYGTFPHPNVLAGFMLVIPLILVTLSETKGIYSSLMLRMTIFLAGVTTILTVSRVAIVAGFLESLLFLRKKLLIWVAFLLVILSPFLYTRFSALFNFDNLSLIRREELTGVAWQVFLAHPILGIGLNNFITQGASELLSGPSRFLQPVHNIFLLSLAETGLLGLLGLLGLIGYPVWKLFNLRATNYELRTLLLIWGIVFFLSLFDHYFLTLPQGYRLLFLLWGISFSMLKS